MISLDKSKNWSSWEDWLATKKANYGSKIGMQVLGSPAIWEQIILYGFWQLWYKPDRK